MNESKVFSSPTHFIFTPPPDTDESENWFSSPTSTSTNGRSSISSIPWAEDAIQQNQDKWEHIERMFYGEEELPSDSKLRNEFLDWMKMFPHIRVTGEQIPFHFDCCAIPSDENYEEIIAIDPPPFQSSLNLQHGIGLRKNLNIDSRKDEYKIPTNRRLSAIDHYQLDKCIRITSGPILSRRNNFLKTDTTPKRPNRMNQKNQITAIREQSPIRIASVKSDFYSRRNINQPTSNVRNTIYMESLSRPVTLSSNSLLKMPPILSIRGIPSSRQPFMSGQSVKVLLHQPHFPPIQSQALRKGRVSLPIITPLLTTGQHFVFERSTSAFSKNMIQPKNEDDVKFDRKLSKLNLR